MKTVVSLPRALAAFLLFGLSLAVSHSLPAQTRAASPTGSGFTLAQVKSYPFPNEMAVAAANDRIVWAFNERGVRNLYTAEGPTFTARKLTSYSADDGQELSAVTISPNGAWVAYVRGGDFGSNFDDALPVNPTAAPVPAAVELWLTSFTGGVPRSLGSGTDPVFSPSSDAVLFVRDRQLWRASLNNTDPPRRLTGVRGSQSDPQYSPDGSRIAFVSNRGDHSFIGIYTNDSTPLQWIAPSVDRDGSPRWSPDGTQLVFTRRAGSGGSPTPPFETRATPWALYIANVASSASRVLYTSASTLPAAVPPSDLQWAALDRIVFSSYADGWPHLYSVLASGGTPLLLTPGNFMVEHVRLAPDKRSIVYSANSGTTAGDIDRRHIARVPVDRAAPEVLTQGAGIEWSPAVLQSGAIAGFSATAQRPPLPMVLRSGAQTLIAADRIPSDFPTAQLVTPTLVQITSADGVRVNAQLFKSASNVARRPAIVYVHGGPSRQMLLGWHYGDYYANAYAMNQYLANQGFVVLSVNYRLGIGYGYDFFRPREAGSEGASEYRDIKAAGEYLRTRDDVDGTRIGVYGGSYGGFLTALALGRDSELFAAGVDIHGVHDFTADGGSRFGAGSWMYERPSADVQRLADVAWRSSPVSSVSTWKSPVLLIHGDDDRNVRFSQTVDLVQRMRANGVPFESIVIPDDTHHWMRFSNQLRVNEATAEFFVRKFLKSSRAP